MGCHGCTVGEIHTHRHNVLQACACFSAPVASVSPHTLGGGGTEFLAFFTEAPTTTPYDLGEGKREWGLPQSQPERSRKQVTACSCHRQLAGSGLLKVVIAVTCILSHITPTNHSSTLLVFGSGAVVDLKN